MVSMSRFFHVKLDLSIFRYELPYLFGPLAYHLCHRPELIEFDSSLVNLSALAACLNDDAELGWFAV